MVGLAVREGDSFSHHECHDGSNRLQPRVHAQAGSVTVALGCRGQVTLPRDYVAQNLDHGYAITIHASQGLTIPRTHVLGNDALFYEAGLVALSRHRDTCHLYITEQLDLSDDRERSHVRRPGRSIARALENSRADQAASSSEFRARESRGR